MQREHTGYKLTDKMQTFVTTFRREPDRVKAYLTAGYITDEHEYTQKQLYNKATQVLCGVRVKAELARLKANNLSEGDIQAEFTLDWVRRKHIEVYNLAVKKQDFATATRNVELIGKTFGAYNEANTITAIEIKQFAESDTLALQDLAALLIDKRTPTGDKVIEATIIAHEPSSKLLKAASEAMEQDSVNT